MKKFKPNLYPNNKTDGTVIDWKPRIPRPKEWYVSEKLEGIRIEIVFDADGGCEIKTRNLKPFRSILIAHIAADITNCGLRSCVIEGEMYCEGMRFNELQHFILSENVCTISSRKKMMREQKHGKFPDRTEEWLSTYDHKFTINLFDIYREQVKQPFYQRLDDLRFAYITLGYASDMFELITQLKFDDLKGIKNLYDETLLNGGEGLILKHQMHIYKCNRNTLPEGMVFKMKDEFNWYSGEVQAVLQGTMVDPNIPTEMNELGYSRTSKLQEDRFPSGRAKGFLVHCHETDTVLTVTLKGFTNPDKAQLLKDELKWVGRIIDFVGMKPTKINGSPRMAKYIK